LAAGTPDQERDKEGSTSKEKGEVQQSGGGKGKTTLIFSAKTEDVQKSKKEPEAELQPYVVSGTYQVDRYSIR